jgi:hypothetical protein
MTKETGKPGNAAQIIRRFRTMKEKHSKFGIWNESPVVYCDGVAPLTKEKASI